MKFKMAKFYGMIGFGTTSETSPGVWTDDIVEKPYRGDINHRRFQNQSSNNINDDINLSMEVSIIKDGFANVNMSRIKYVVYKGAKWKVSNVDEKYPRLILTIGGVYNEE